MTDQRSWIRLLFVLLCGVFSDTHAVWAGGDDGQECAAQDESEFFYEELRRREHFDRRVAAALCENMTPQEVQKWLLHIELLHQEIDKRSQKKDRQSYVPVSLPAAPTPVDGMIERFEETKKRGSSEYAWTKFLTTLQRSSLARTDRGRLRTPLLRFADALAARACIDVADTEVFSVADHRAIASLMVRHRLGTTPSHQAVFSQIMLPNPKTTVRSQHYQWRTNIRIVATDELELWENEFGIKTYHCIWFCPAQNTSQLTLLVSESPLPKKIRNGRSLTVEMKSRFLKRNDGRCVYVGAITDTSN